MKLTEILGALAVVLSLIFVGVQLNENTRATKSAMASAMVDTSSAWYVELGNSEEASSVMFFFSYRPRFTYRCAKIPGHYEPSRFVSCFPKQFLFS